MDRRSTQRAWSPPNRSLLLFVLLVVVFFVSLDGDFNTPSITEYYSASRASSVQASISYHQLAADARPDLRNSPRAGTLSVFDDIFVISLQRRADRRARMDKIATALQMNVTYSFATEADSSVVSHALEHVRQIRAIHNATDFQWPSNDTTSSAPLVGSELWTLDQTDPRAAPLPPSPAEPDTHPPLGTMTQKWNLLPAGNLPLNSARIACWHSHQSVVRRIADQEDPDYAALVLEDDVDLDWTTADQLQRVWDSRALPKDWDMLYLGYCPTSNPDPRAGQTHYPALPHAPNVRPSWLPMCTHGYALSRDGARRILSQLSYELFAYSRPIDNAYAFLIGEQRIKSFSFVPPLIIQLRDGVSDIWGYDIGKTAQVDFLLDSTLERVHIVEEMLANLTESG